MQLGEDPPCAEDRWRAQHDRTSTRRRSATMINRSTFTCRHRERDPRAVCEPAGAGAGSATPRRHSRWVRSYGCRMLRWPVATCAGIPESGLSARSSTQRRHSGCTLVRGKTDEGQVPRQTLQLSSATRRVAGRRRVRGVTQIRKSDASGSVIQLQTMPRTAHARAMREIEPSGWRAMRALMRSRKRVLPASSRPMA